MDFGFAGHLLVKQTNDYETVMLLHLIIFAILLRTKYLLGNTKPNKRHIRH